MRCAPALLKVSTVQLAPSPERPAATQSVLPSIGATKPSSETDIFRTSEAMRCFLPESSWLTEHGHKAGLGLPAGRPGGWPGASRARWGAAPANLRGHTNQGG